MLLNAFHRYNKGTAIPQSHSVSFKLTLLYPGEEGWVKRQRNNPQFSLIILTKLKNSHALDLNSASVSATLSHTFQRETDAFVSRPSGILACAVLSLLPCALSQHMPGLEQSPKQHLSLNVSNNIGKPLSCSCPDLLCQLLRCSLSRLGWCVRMWPLTTSYAVHVSSVPAPNKLRIQILFSGQPY